MPTRPVYVLQDQHARVGAAVRVRGGKSQDVRLGKFLVDREPEPLGEQVRRVVRS